MEFPPLDCLQKAVLRLLQDGMPHTREELAAVINCLPSNKKYINRQIDRVREVICLGREDIICEVRGRVQCFRHIKLLYSGGRGSSWIYSDLTQRVKERDQGLCQDCGKRGIHVHHIKSWYGYPDLRFRVNNCVLLCESCHISRGRKDGSAGRPKGATDKHNYPLPSLNPG